MNDLLFFDLEATGTDPITDRVIEVAVVGMGGKTLFGTLVNPGRPIPLEVRALTGISDEMAHAAPSFADIAEGLAALLRDRPLCGFGCTEFDVPLLAEEFERAGAAYRLGDVLDVGHLYKALRPRTLAAAVGEFAGRDHTGAHRATADAVAVSDVLAGMRFFEPRAEDCSFAELRALARGDRPERADPAGRLLVLNGVICFGTHRNKGVPVADDLGYAEWMLRQDFPRSTLRVLREELRRIEREADARLEAAMATASVPPGDTPEIPF